MNTNEKEETQRERKKVSERQRNKWVVQNKLIFKLNSSAVAVVLLLLLLLFEKKKFSFPWTFYGT